MIRQSEWMESSEFLTWYRTSSFTEFKNSVSVGYRAQANINSSHTSNLKAISDLSEKNIRGGVGGKFYRIFNRFRCSIETKT